MDKVQIKPLRPVYPSPAALITSIDEGGRPNIVTLGECFNVSVRKPVIVGIAIRTATYSHGLIRRQGEFTVNLPTVELMRKVDAIGMLSGRDCDKFERFGLTPLPAREVAPPLVAECPLNLECRVLSEQEVGDHQLFLGEVLLEHVDADRLDTDGQIDPEKLDTFIFAAWNYYALGPRIGRFGMSRD
ncbi:MAG: flavin reductase family protein [Planctomycetota bacterium]|jgi:flavin reductase (DIM6/NTAB) family NADH-FMN oxidoreductase RutF